MKKKVDNIRSSRCKLFMEAISSTVPCEFLYERACSGDKESLLKLFHHTKGMWRSWVPTDPTGMLLDEDWIAIGDAYFFEVWRKFDPARNVKFSTWIYSCVRLYWYSLITKLNAKKRYSGQASISYEEFSEILDVSYCESFVYDNLNYEELLSMFCRYIERKTDFQSVRIFNLYFLQGCSIRDLVEDLKCTVFYANERIKQIRELGVEFFMSKEVVLNAV